VDRVEEDGKVLIHEGHDSPRAAGQLDPKLVDRPLTTPTGDPTQNGLFYGAAMRYRRNEGEAELVKVYEKIRPGIWVYNGLSGLWMCHVRDWEFGLQPC
jgi:hypothetical protein